MILSKEAITAATDAIHHVVEAAAEQVYLNALDRLYVVRRVATHAFVWLLGGWCPVLWAGVVGGV